MIIVGVLPRYLLQLEQTTVASLWKQASYYLRKVISACSHISGLPLIEQRSTCVAPHSTFGNVLAWDSRFCREKVTWSLVWLFLPRQPDILWLVGAFDQTSMHVTFLDGGILYFCLNSLLRWESMESLTVHRTAKQWKHLNTIRSTC